MTLWDKPFIFERTSNIYTFSKNPLHQKNNHHHLFIPWDTNIENELMIKIKNHITSTGKCLIPFMDSKHQAKSITDEKVELLKMQSSLGIETHLIMSNMDSIHIFKVSNIIKRKIQKLKDSQTIDIFSNGKSNFEFWIEVDDLFVYKANHGDGKNSIIAELEKIVNSQQTQSFFIPIQKFQIGKEDSEQVCAKRWIDLNRNLTYDYFIRSCELEENIYQDSWTDLSRRSQHCLIISEQARHKAVLHKEDEKLLILKESFESYISGLINELNEVYISPLINAFMEYSSLQEAWDDIQDGLVNPELRVILNTMYATDEKQITDLDSFLVYVSTIKSCLFSFKHRFAKKIGKEEYLLIEHFLSRQENMIESFLCRNLNSKIKSILEVKEWLGHIVNNLDSLSGQDKKNAALKLTHILTILTSTSYEDNLFFKLIEEKTSKGVVKRSFEDEVKSLNKLCSLSLAS